MFCPAGLNETDRVYVSLPIYHGNGFFIGIGSAIVCGATVGNNNILFKLNNTSFK
jgi:acyl-CoA synthetase (AMP-forming)/AMP-acid ligase II